jgi:hypothetical protein
MWEFGCNIFDSSTTVFHHSWPFPRNNPVVVRPTMKIASRGAFSLKAASIFPLLAWWIAGRFPQHPAFKSSNPSMDLSIPLVIESSKIKASNLILRQSTWMPETY